MELDKFYDPSNGFLVNDTCIVVAEVLNEVQPAVFKTRIEYLRNRSAGLVDLKCIYKKEIYFVRIFEDILDHYTRVENFKKKRKRSQEFKEWSLIALERVLYFLKTQIMKNVNHDACKELQILWDELKVFGFEEFTSLELHL
ncbi:hypothetical protein PIB30_016565 [Stylosanthes scabra]|uniref:MATH domain-containing protein n=1 Tax=Stylosanthes scabra TaxID=79078 RepID=A0ABU6S8N2_9FABA|nr:hypothetical protein [Stylosanthes scabra]